MSSNSKQGEAVSVRIVDAKVKSPPEIIKRDKLLSDFWDKLCRRSRGTAEFYVLSIKKLVESLGLPNSTELIKRVESGEVDPYTTIDNFVALLLKEGNAPLSVYAHVSAVKRFLVVGSAGRIELNDKKLKNLLNLPKARPKTKDATLVKEELDQLFSMASLKGRVMLVFLAHGLRIGEASSLTTRDILAEDEIPHIVIREEIAKGGNPRLVPMSQELVNLLRVYYKKYRIPEGARIFGHYGRENGERVYYNKSSSNQLRRAFYRLLKTADLASRDMNTTRHIHVYHPHTLRKRFRTVCALKSVPEEITRLMLGQIGYLDRSYLRTRLPEIKTWFDKIEAEITFGTTLPKTRIIDSTLAMLKAQGITKEELDQKIEKHFHAQISPVKEIISVESAESPRQHGMSIYELISTMFPDIWRQILRELVRDRVASTGRRTK